MINKVAWTSLFKRVYRAYGCMRRQNSIKFDVKGWSGMESINLEEQSTHVGVIARRRSTVKYERTVEKYRVKKEEERGARRFSKLPVELPVFSTEASLSSCQDGEENKLWHTRIYDMRNHDCDLSIAASNCLKVQISKYPARVVFKLNWSYYFQVKLKQLEFSYGM